MIDPAPYKTIAVASTFSPRFKQVLSEAKRIRDRFSSDLRAIYVGERNEETTKKFSDVFAQLQLPNDSIIHYEQGDPPEAILRAMRRIVFVADYSEHGLQALKTTLPLALAESCERLYVIRIITTFDQARASRRANGGNHEKGKANEHEEDALEKFVLSAGATEVPIEARCVRGNTGLAASDFVQSVEADLLVVPVRANEETGEQLPNNIAWIIDVIPCNLWVIR